MSSARERFSSLLEHAGLGSALYLPRKQADITVGSVVLYINDVPHDMRRWIAEQGYPPPAVYASSTLFDLWPILSQNVTEKRRHIAGNAAADLTQIVPGLQIGAEMRYSLYETNNDAAIFVPSNPCTRLTVDQTREDLAQWWEAVQHLVFSRYPDALKYDMELHLVTETISMRKWQIHYQQHGSHQFGLAMNANANVPGFASAGGTASKDVTVMHSTTALSQSYDIDNYTCFMKTVPVKRKRILGTNWARRVFEMQRFRTKRKALPDRQIESVYLGGTFKLVVENRPDQMSGVKRNEYYVESSGHRTPLSIPGSHYAPLETLFEQQFQVEAIQLLPKARNLDPDWDLRTKEAKEMGHVLYEDNVSGDVGICSISQYPTW